MSKSGNYRSLIRSGEANEEQCLEAWEKIVQKNNYHSGNNQYDNYLNLLHQYNLAMKELNAVVSTILCLHCASVLGYDKDEEQIKYLKGKRYKIDTTSDDAYDNSLSMALHESGRLRSKIKMKYNQIANFNQRVIEQNKSQGETTVDELISGLSMEVGFQIPDTITLSQYNAYGKRVKKRNEAIERNRASEPKGKYRKHGNTA